MPHLPDGRFLFAAQIAAKVRLIRFIWGESYDALPPEQKTPAKDAQAVSELARADELEGLK